MSLLIDTYALIWFLNGDKLISVNAKAAIENTDNIKIVSIASIWEIAIKISLNRYSLPKGLMHFLNLIEENGKILCSYDQFDHKLRR